ncbi:LytR/AlgR family response regulator transcription factor [Hufsiella ginkgonis]|uniref:Response regulator n=1 Tax=Hufsiella ginkgonis TaxID=2695274 RepID=A0A7K1XZ64_9SPHI|nr:LytTR family DNA-binding domain-containing protein [Hufsiella ginkgonis]MXV16029.1 response regulator [Hufsiella ginkgonis]
MYKCVIIDDESHAIEGLERYINSIPDLELVKSYMDPIDALREISESDPVDIIFLDVDMPKITGIELSRHIRGKTNKLIFTTAHTKYGYDAFEAEADAYLLKPYSLAKFAATISKLFPKRMAAEEPLLMETPKEKSDFFFVKSKEDNLKLIRISFADVIAVESKLNYVMIHTTKRKVLAYISLREISAILEEYPGFVRFQRSFIISQNHIEFIDGNMIKMNNGITITVGEYYRKHFTAFVSEKLIKAGRKN